MYAFLKYHFLGFTISRLFLGKPAFKFLPAVFYVKLSRVTIPGKQVCFPCRDIIIIVVVIIIITSPSLLSAQKTSRVIIAALRYHFRPQVRAHPRNISRLLVLPSQSIPRSPRLLRFQDDSLLDDSSASSHFELEHETIRRRGRAAKLFASGIRETILFLIDCVTRDTLLFLNFKLGLHLYKTVSSPRAVDLLDREQDRYIDECL